tara:strand:- start:74 stop:187 length:114 start_codon:yes stop_codon:yes gene_type:complete
MLYPIELPGQFAAAAGRELGTSTREVKAATFLLTRQV